MNTEERFSVFTWVRTQGENLIAEAKSVVVEKPTIEQFAKECEAHGKALAVMEIARLILDEKWLGDIAEITEKRRLADHKEDVERGLK